ncbi:MAG TPA: ABC transporter permease [bacterium]|nr:ABC transporter permease [bacterium]
MSALEGMEVEAALPGTPAAVAAATPAARSGVSRRQLVWRRFLRSRAALAGGAVVALFYVMALCADFLAPYTVDQRFIQYLYLPPQAPHFSPRLGFYVDGITSKVDQNTLLTTFAPDGRRRIPVRFFVHGEPYRMAGLIASDVHLFGVADPDMGVFLAGTDRQGRDMLSRLLIGSQMSLTIGLVGVALSLVIGSVLGVVSGYYGGPIDELVQRGIEVIRSFPAIPLWMALTAALPQHWPPERVYFAITVILSVIGWTWLARQLRGRVLALRDEEFVTAARVMGASDARIIFRHLLPQVFGLIVVIATLAMPGMILAETALSFLNLGLRPPLTSWGVLLQEAQNLESLRHYPWLLSPAVFISITVLAFNFFGDGLRDAADPYSA